MNHPDIVVAHAVAVDNNGINNMANPIAVASIAPPSRSSNSKANEENNASFGLNRVPSGGNFSVNELALREYLTSFDWPNGLQESLIKGLTKTPMRFMIIDDSGSMAASDGHRLVGKGSQTKLVECTRWSEICDSMRFHAGLAESACAPTEFRLLNGLPPLMLGLGGDNDGSNMHRLLSAFEQSPSGGTPLCSHIGEVIQQIQRAEQQLRSSGSKAVVVIATDGESSDGDLAAAMRPLKSLPVWVVVRLCTDNDKIVNYWNNIDQELELDMDVLDDMCSEAQEVTSNNPWLTYAEPIHRLREFGIPIKELDLLDESKLSIDQLQGMMAIIFGGKKNDYPHPGAGWPEFMHVIRERNRGEKSIWCPVRKQVSNWIKEDKLTSTYNPSLCVVM